jgi:hypothetical protein
MIAKVENRRILGRFGIPGGGHDSASPNLMTTKANIPARKNIAKEARKTIIPIRPAEALSSISLNGESFAGICMLDTT